MSATGGRKKSSKVPQFAFPLEGKEQQGELIRQWGRGEACRPCTGHNGPQAQRYESM